MTILVVGGGPLGMQACRLAQAAGLRVVVTDGNSDCPAASLSDEFVTLSPGAMLPAADFVLPATEDASVLASLGGENVLFDPDAWAITSSRLASDEFLRRNGIPIPAYFPDGAEPYIVKPDRGSFGRGIWVTEDFCEVGGAVNAGFVAQEELDGPVWSVAVIRRDKAAAYPPARLTFDGRRQRMEADCIPAPEADALLKTAVRIADALNLRGILEAEAIFHGGVWRVTDLNARLPMLTPDALLASAGVNLLTELCGL